MITGEAVFIMIVDGDTKEEVLETMKDLVWKVPPNTEARLRGIRFQHETENSLEKWGPHEPIAAV